MGKKKPAPLAFCFGDPEPVLSGAVYEYLGVWLLDNGRYYATPVPWSGLARLLRYWLHCLRQPAWRYALPPCRRRYWRYRR